MGSFQHGHAMLSGKAVFCELHREVALWESTTGAFTQTKAAKMLLGSKISWDHCYRCCLSLAKMSSLCGVWLYLYPQCLPLKKKKMGYIILNHL